MSYRDSKKYKEYQAEYFQKNKERINEYRKQYNKNVMSKLKKEFHVSVDRDIMEDLENKLLKDGLTKADFLRKAIQEYLKD